MKVKDTRLGIERLVNGSFSPLEYRKWLNAAEKAIENIENLDFRHDNFRWIKIENGEPVFANGILPAITLKDIHFLITRPHVFTQMRRMIDRSVH